MRAFVFLSLCFLIFNSCKKENNGYDSNYKGWVMLEFDNVVGNDDLKLTTGTYVNAAGESFTVRALRYFVSNIKLLNTDGSEYVVPQDSSYFLIDESVSTVMPLFRAPEGEYKGLTFTIGVDSLRSTMDGSSRKGVLLPSVSNYLDENRGYIFFSMEGASPSAPQSRYDFDIAGYGGKSSPTINNLRTVTLDLAAGGISKVREGDQSIIHIMADVQKVFSGTQQISIAANSIIQFEPFSANIANNYAMMFSHDHTHN